MKLLLAIMAFKVECLCVDVKTIEHALSSYALLSLPTKPISIQLQISVEEFHSSAKLKRARKNGEREFN